VTQTTITNVKHFQLCGFNRQEVKAQVSKCESVKLAVKLKTSSAGTLCNYTTDHGHNCYTQVFSLALCLQMLIIHIFSFQLQITSHKN